MKTYILITGKELSFEKIKNVIENSFFCSQVTPNRLTVEKGDEHIFIDYDDSMRNDYE